MQQTIKGRRDLTCMHKKKKKKKFTEFTELFLFLRVCKIPSKDKDIKNK